MITKLHHRQAKARSLDKLLRMKPAEYKNLSNREKNETQFQYNYEKSKTESIEKK